jgi:hypothetical protein
LAKDRRANFLGFGIDPSQFAGTKKAALTSGCVNGVICASDWRGVCATLSSSLSGGDSTVDKHVAMGVFVGGIFAAIITSIAALDGFAAGGFVLLACVVFGLAAGLCIGGLIAANFAMLAVEEKEKEEVDAHSRSAARVAA